MGEIQILFLGPGPKLPPMSQPSEPTESQLQSSFMRTQSSADCSSTLRTYESRLKQLSKHLDRVVYHPDVLDHDSPERQQIVPVSMRELLQFLERKKDTKRIFVSDDSSAIQISCQEISYEK